MDGQAQGYGSWLQREGGNGVQGVVVQHFSSAHPMSESYSYSAQMTCNRKLFYPKKLGQKGAGINVKKLTIEHQIY